jgi:hypothetical protein
MLSGIGIAEARLGKPPSILEALISMKQMYPELPINNVYEVSAVLATLMREDWIYTNEIASHISLHRVENYRNFSEMFRYHFKD